MKYVSYIDYGWGDPFGFAQYPVGVAVDGRVTVTDSDGSVETVELVNLRGTSYIGSGFSKLGKSGYLARHNDKTAQLYRHVVSADTVLGAPEFEVSGEDLVVVCEEGLVGAKDNGGAGRFVAINTTNEYIEVMGYKGSVVTRSEELDDKPQVFTLYGMLGKLCRWSRVNLMTYEHIRVYSPGRRYETKIVLSQTPEAQRYFMKMFLDVMSGRGLAPCYD